MGSRIGRVGSREGSDEVLQADIFISGKGGS